MTKDEFLLSMYDAWLTLPVEDPLMDGTVPDDLKVLEDNEYKAHFSPSGGVMIGWRLTKEGRAAWEAVHAANK